MEGLHRQTTRRELLKSLKAARNAVVHEDEPRLATLRAAGYRIDLTWIRRWRSALNGLSATLDSVMATHLARLFDASEPW